MDQTTNPSAASGTRVCLITGANTGIGRVTARELARDGFHVFIAGRSPERTGAAIEAIKRETGNPHVAYLPLDLGDLDSVRTCAAAFLAQDLPLHLLINNAGLAGKRGLTASGFEMAFGTNHVGHFLLTELLRARLIASAPARIVIVASRAHRLAKQLDFEAVRRPTRSLFGAREYGVSKLANILHSAELGRRLAGTGVHTYALHPGVVETDLWRYVVWPLRTIIVKARKMLTVEEGAQTTLYCARAAEVADQTGLYYADCRVVTPLPLARDSELARALYEQSLQWVGLPAAQAMPTPPSTGNSLPVT